MRGQPSSPSRGGRRRDGRGRQPGGEAGQGAGQSVLVVLVDGVVEGELDDASASQPNTQQNIHRRPFEMETAVSASLLFATTPFRAHGRPALPSLSPRLLRYLEHPFRSSRYSSLQQTRWT